MSLPTPDQLKELAALVIEEGKMTKGKWYTYKGMCQSLERSSGTMLVGGAGSAAKYGVTAASGVGPVVAAGSTVAVAGMAITLVPFAAVLTPWIAAADIVRAAGDIFELHDLKEAAAQGIKSEGYSCVCGKCFDNIKYVVDKKERNVARMAISVATLGVSSFFTTINSIYKSFQAGRPKEMVSRGLVESGRTKGCTVALAAVFLMSGNWEFMRGGNAGTMRRAIAIITSEDGWEVLKGEW